MSDDKDNNVRAMFAAPEELAPAPPDVGEGQSSPPRKRAKGPPWYLPDDAPVECLGIAGELCFYLDANRQMRTVKAKDHSRLNVYSLFGQHAAYLYEVWPRMKQDKDGTWFSTGWMPEAAAESLMQACARRGVWDVTGRVRGLGGWVAPDGGLVLHCGDAIWVGPGPGNGAGIYLAPGAYGPYVYPAAMAGPRPHDEAQPGGEAGPGWHLLELYKSWNWRRGEDDARLLLGATGAMILGAALDWRPSTWITGDIATGKSTLHKLLKLVVGGILSTSNTTAAGIWQKVGHSALPVAIDELEAKSDNRKAEAVLELAKEAASGGVILRGGQDHIGAEFYARNCFLFSSVLIPPLTSADISRMSILELGALDGLTPPKLDETALADLGRRLRRRLCDGWPDFAERLERWRQQLATAGHKGRGADQFGTLLAIADMLLFDDLPDREADEADRLAAWTKPLAAHLLAARDQGAADHTLCVHHMLTSPADAWRGGARETIGTYIRRAAGLDKTASDAARREADEILGRIGLRVIDEPDHETGERAAWLAVANTHQGLAVVFKDTQWAARSGKLSVWMQAMRRVEARRADGGRIVALADSRSFNGISCRCTLVPLAAVFPEDSAGD